MKLEVVHRGPEGKAHETPIVFVHGMMHSASCWSPHFLPYFAESGYDCYAMSLRGHGASEGREKLAWTPLSDYVADLAEVVGGLRHLPILIGHSMGGGVVPKYLSSHDAAAAVLLAPVPPSGLIGTALRFARSHPLVFLKGIFSLNLRHMVGTQRLAQELFFSMDLPEERMREFFSLIQDESFRVFLDLILLDRPPIGAIKIPILVLGAANDAALPPAEVEATARAYGTTAEFYPNMAHDMMLEAGWKAVADRIRVWLAEKGL